MQRKEMISFYWKRVQNAVAPRWVYKDYAFDSAVNFIGRRMTLRLCKVILLAILIP